MIDNCGTALKMIKQNGIAFILCSKFLKTHELLYQAF